MFLLVLGSWMILFGTKVLEFVEIGTALAYNGSLGGGLMLAKRPYLQSTDVLRNQRGAMGVLLVAMISIVIVTTLSTVYMYIVNRAKYQARIRQAYIMTQVMEDFGRMLRQARDTAISSGVTTQGAACPGGTVSFGAGGSPICLSSCPAPGTPGVPANACNFGGSINYGFPCLQHLGRWYCLESSTAMTTSENRLPNFENFAVRSGGDLPSEETPVLERVASMFALQTAWASLKGNYYHLGDVREMCRYSPDLAYCKEHPPEVIEEIVRVEDLPNKSEESSPGKSQPIEPGTGIVGIGGDENKTFPETGAGAGTPSPGGGPGSQTGTGSNPAAGTGPGGSPPASPPTQQATYRLEPPDCEATPNDPRCQRCQGSCVQVTYCFRGLGSCQTAPESQMIQFVKLE